jgi:hypothetical protein
MASINGLGKWFKKQAQGVEAQVNPFDNGASYGTVMQNRPVAPGPPVIQQAAHLGGGLARGIAQPVVGTATDFSQFFGNLGTKLGGGTPQTTQQFWHGTPGANTLLNVSGPGTGSLHHFLGSAGQAGLMALPGGAVADAGKPLIARAALGAVKAAPIGAGFNVLAGATQGAPMQSLPKMALQGAELGAELGLAAPLAKPVAQQSAKAGKAAYDATVLPRPARLNDNQVATISQFRQKMGTGEMMGPEANNLYHGAKNALNKVGINHTDTEAIDNLLGKFQTYNSKRAQREGGFVKLPGGDEAKLGPTQTEFPDEAKLNTERLNLPEADRQQLGQETIQVIDRLSNKDIQNIAKNAGLDTKTYNVDQVKQMAAEQLNVRQQAVKLMNDARATTDPAEKEALLSQAAEIGRTTRAQGTGLAQQLQARRIIANELDSPEQRIFKLLDEAGVNPDVYSKRLAEVDFNNPKEVIRAYREMVPAKASNWVDTVRYNSMLSSPLTQAVNAFSNAMNVGVVAPIEKTLRGVFSHNYAAGEGLAYSKGAAGGLGKASHEFMNAIRGNSPATNLDLAGRDTPLAVGGVKGATYNTLSFPMKVLTASDKFFRAIASEGEMNALNLRESKGIRVVGNKQGLADKEAAYRVFQQDNNVPGQGKILDGIDGLTSSIMNARAKVPGMKWVLPFVKTPMSILKQGVEFSPLGAVNAISAEEKATALTRAAIGTAVFGTAATMLAGGDMTWGEPTDPKQKAAFRAEGKQPYAIKIGNNWVSFTKVPPAVAFPFALTAAINDAVNSKKMSESIAEAVMEGVAKWGGFLSDQSYLKSIGDTIAATKGDPDKAVQAIANYPQQLVPFRALTGWVARLSDPSDRQVAPDKGWVDSQVQALMLQYPGLRGDVGTKTNPYTGGPLEANNHVFNNLSPVKVTKDQGYGNTSGLNMDQRLGQANLAMDQKGQFRQEALNQKESTSNDAKAKKQLQSGSNKSITLSSGKVYVKVGNQFKTFDNQQQANEAKTKYDFQQSGQKVKVVGDKVLLKTKSGVTVKDKAEYDYSNSDSQLSLNMDRAKRSDDLKSWFDSANKRYDVMKARRDSFDPETEANKIADMDKKMESLQAEADKYNGYGGFKKGKNGLNKNGGVSLPNISTSIPEGLQSPVIARSQIQAPRLALSKKGSPSVKVRSSKVKINAPKRLA